ncbi:MAG: hypothetical protein P1U68_07165 [Verrucomicrobiales bacterium]|nr:hypothetical protein [Verrucomicrobiales bacterium]
MDVSLPNLFVIGDMKVGTTSLHAFLNSYLDILAFEVKEVDYFVK